MGTLFRLTVMVATLGALGLAAVQFGPPQVVQPVARRVIELVDEKLGREPHRPGEVAPEADPSLALLESGGADRRPFEETPLRIPAGADSAKAPGGGMAALTAPPLTAPLRQERPDPGEASDESTAARVRAAPKSAAGVPGPRSEGLSKSSGDAARVAAISMAATGAAPPVRQPAGAAELADLEAQLREAGAADTRLQRWGGASGLHRVCCEVPLWEGAPAVRHFEAIARTPSAAVREVLAQVRGWRAASGPTR